MFCNNDNQLEFGYTEWQHQYFDEMTSGEFAQKALEYAEKHPYIGNAERL